MKNHRAIRTRRLCLTVALALFYSSSVLPDTIPGIPGIRQEQSNWCWAAVCLSIVKYYIPDFNKTQTEVAGVLTTKDIAPEPEELITCLEENGKAADLQAEMVMGPLPWKTIKQEADDKHPFYFLIRWDSRSYHSNVFCGYIKDSTRLKFMDPDNGHFIIRTYNASLNINNGIGTWERSFLTNAKIIPVINNARPFIRNNSLKIVHEKNASGRGITFIAINAAINDHILAVYTTSGSCIYETLLRAPRTQVTWETQNVIPTGTYIATLLERNRMNGHRVASQSFSIVK